MQAAGRLLAIGAVWQTDSAGLLASYRAATKKGFEWSGACACTLSGRTGSAEELTGVMIVSPSFVERQIDAACKGREINAVVVGTLGRHQMVSAVTARLSRRGMSNVVLTSGLSGFGRYSLMTQPGIRRLRESTLRLTRAVAMDEKSLKLLFPIEILKQHAFESGVECIISISEKGITLQDGQGVYVVERAFEQVPDNDYVGTLAAVWFASGGQAGQEMLASISGDLER